MRFPKLPSQPRPWDGHNGDERRKVGRRSHQVVKQKGKKMKQTNLFKKCIREPFEVRQVNVFRRNQGFVVRDHKRFRRSAEGVRNVRMKASHGAVALDDTDDDTRKLIHSMLIDDKIKLARGELTK